MPTLPIGRAVPLPVFVKEGFAAVSPDRIPVGSLAFPPDPKNEPLFEHLEWLASRRATVAWGAHAIGTVDEQPSCAITLRDSPFAATAPTFLDAVVALRRMAAG